MARVTATGTLDSRPMRLCRALVASGLLLAGCDSGGIDPSRTTVAGNWAGRASGIETADFILVLIQAGSSLTGTGEVFLPGNGNRFPLDATGSMTGLDVALTIQLRRGGPAISYAGSVDRLTITGRLNGGDIQHDGPFSNTPLTLTKQ